MLDEQGRFDFTNELLDLMEAVWNRYEEKAGCAQSARERLVGLAYIVAALRHDIDAIGAQLLAAPELQGLDLAGPLHEVFATPESREARAVKDELARRGWL